MANQIHGRIAFVLALSLALQRSSLTLTHPDAVDVTRDRYNSGYRRWYRAEDSVTGRQVSRRQSGVGGTERQGDDQEEGEEEQDDPVSTVVVTAVLGSAAWMPCDIGGGSVNNPLPSPPKTAFMAAGEKSEDRAYMVLWFKYHSRQLSSMRYDQNDKPDRLPTGGKPIYSFDVRGRPLASALKWSSDETNGGFGARASFVVFNSGGELISRGTPTDGNDQLHRENDQDSSSVFQEIPEKNDGAALMVTNITEQDGGAYRCRVDFKDAPTRNYRIILRVIVPPDKMTIAYDTGTVTAEITEIEDDQNDVGPVPEGGRLVLVCLVRGGKPRPRVRWYSVKHGGMSSLHEITDSVEEESFGADGSAMTVRKFTIKRLDRSHANSSYVCMANTDNIKDPTMRRTVNINMYLNVQRVVLTEMHQLDPPANPEIVAVKNEYDGYEERQQNMVAGKWYTAECLAEGASPRATIQWTIDGNGTQSGAVEESASQTAMRLTVIKQTSHSSTIRLRPTPNDDGRYLRCRARNPEVISANDNNMKNDAVLMNVMYPPIVKLSLGHTFDPNRIKTGDDVYFECAVSMNDGGGRGVKRHRNRIEWYHEGKPILQNGSSSSSDVTNVLLSTGTLVIRSVGRHHSGRYTCQCSNELGIGRSRPVFLRVRFAPVCADDNDSRRPRLVGVEGVGETNVHVTCRVRADPEDQVQFEWLVWPGAVAAGSAVGMTGKHHHHHHHHHPNIHDLGASASAADSYVTTALSNYPKNDTSTAMVAYGQLVLTVSATREVPQDIYSAEGSAATNFKGSSVKPPSVLNTVSCRATNSIGRQSIPCIYYITQAAAPSLLTGCVIKMPKDHEIASTVDDSSSQKQRRRLSNDEPAIVSCNAGNDGGVRPVTYSLKVYEGLLLSAQYNYGEPNAVDEYEPTRRRRNEWLVGNVTGTVVEGSNRVEYVVSRQLLQLKIGDSDNRRYLSLSTYADNRMGHGPETRIGGENTLSLRHPWWWQGGYEETSTRTAVSGTSSTEWWVMLGGGNGNRKNKNTEDDRGTSSLVTIVFSIGSVLGLVVLTLLLRKKMCENRSLVTETVIGSSLIAGTNGSAEDQCANGANKKYSLFSQQQLNGYPHLDVHGVPGDAPDITIQQDVGKPCFVTIPDNGIPGPESCV